MCIRCGACVGFACPVDARNGVHSTVLPRAIDAGADLLLGAHVAKVGDDGQIEVIADGTSRTVRAGRVVLAGGAIETARLLLLSGLGNDWVGDCLQGHTYTGAFGLFDEPVIDGLGPGPSIATRGFAHDNEGIVGGGLLANEFIKIPTMFLLWGLHPDIPRSGPELRPAMAEAYRRTSHVTGPLQEVPVRSAQVRLSRTVVDQNGLPVARFDGVQHPEDQRGAQFLAARAQEWLRAAGATRTWTAVPPPMLSGGQHQAGTARMAESPDQGATDPFGQGVGHRPRSRGRRQPPCNQRRRQPRPDDHGPGLAHGRAPRGHRLTDSASSSARGLLLEPAGHAVEAGLTARVVGLVEVPVLDAGLALDGDVDAGRLQLLGVGLA